MGIKIWFVAARSDPSTTEPTADDPKIMIHHANHSAAGSPLMVSLGRILSFAMADEAPGGSRAALTTPRSAPASKTAPSAACVKVVRLDARRRAAGEPPPASRPVGT